jgi:hypothetical protein
MTDQDMLVTSHEATDPAEVSAVKLPWHTPTCFALSVAATHEGEIESTFEGEGAATGLLGDTYYPTVS